MAEEDVPRARLRVTLRVAALPAVVLVVVPADLERLALAGERKAMSSVIRGTTRRSRRPWSIRTGASIVSSQSATARSV